MNSDLRSCRNPLSTCLSGAILGVVEATYRAPAVTACGFIAATGLLLGQLLIYASPSQTFGMTLSSMCASAALSILHMTLREPTFYPTALQVVLAPTAHAVHGVMGICTRMSRKHGSRHAAVRAMKSSSGKPLVVVDASGDVEVIAPKAVFSEIQWALLAATWTWATVAVSYDIGLYILCKVSRDMCKGGIINAGFNEPVASWIPPQLVHVLQRPAVKLCLFSLAAGNLLPLAMDFIYCTARILVLLTAMICQWPDLGDQAAQMPLRAFNHPMAAKSITELWGFRWHQFLRFYFEGLACAAVDLLLPKGKQVPHAVRTSLRFVSAFLLSGIIHEYMTWAAYGTLTGTAMAFFGLHCAAILVENLVPAMMKAVLHGGRKQRRPSTSTPATDSHPAADAQRDCTACHRKTTLQPLLAKAASTWPSVRPIVGNLWALAFIALSSPLFVEPYRAAGIFGHAAFHPLGVPMCPRVVDWATHHLQSFLQTQHAAP